ncbi:MAG: aminotransferase class I/II-fold pyridoxal phosphate-dependent enzyme [Bacillaceae bacterium]
MQPKGNEQEILEQKQAHINKHSVAPLLDAHQQYVQKDIIPFDVPGHKRGNGNNYLQDLFGKQTMKLDVNSLPELDQLSHPTGVIKESQALMADAYSADAAFFMVNGTSSSVHAMILSACKPGDKILLPRNIHKSAINALILSGAVPIYMDVEIEEQLGIATTVSDKVVIETIFAHRDAKAILLLNPSYWGFCANLKKIVGYAKKYNILVLVDEAHGAHFPFHKDLPPSAISLGADLVATSIHKTGGALTQSSVLLANKGNIDLQHVAMIINMIQSTSASYLLMSSLDGARKNLVLHGNEIFNELLPLIKHAKKEINQIPGLSTYGSEIIGSNGIYNLDETKIAIHVSEIGLTGFEVYEILRKEYRIQMELGDAYNVLAIVSLGDDERTLKSLVDALRDLSKSYFKRNNSLSRQLIPRLQPEVIMNPREAFYAEKEMVSLQDSIGRISGESLMAYPPGIPILSPGERITAETIEYIAFLKKQQANLTDAKDVHIETLTVIKQGVW